MAQGLWSPSRHMLFVGAVVHDGTNGYQQESFCVSSDNQNAESWKTCHRHRKRDWMPKYNNGPISHNDEPQAAQMNFAQDSIEALHRRVLSGHMVVPEPVVLVRRTQSDAATADNTSRPRLHDVLFLRHDVVFVKGYAHGECSK